MTGGESIKKTLEEKRNEGWEGWKVPVLLLHHVIEKSIEQGLDYIVIAIESKEYGKKMPEDGHLTILGLTMDKEVRDSHLKVPSNPDPIPYDPPGQIDQFPPW
jgi:hypothetical protein